MSASIPVRHHYIPKFLLRPFCFEPDRLHYYDKNIGITIDRRIEEAFMERNLYRDEVNNPNNPVKIERDFAKFEGEVAQIIARFRDNDEIVLAREEEERLKLFLALLSFRSPDAEKEFSEKSSEEFKAFYAMYDETGDLNAFWKKNLEAIANCRSVREVANRQDIADPLKIFMQRDAESWFGAFFTICEKRGSEDFLLGDVSPCRIYMGKIPMLSYIPLSPNRVLLCATNFTIYAPERFLGFNRSLFKPPHYGKSRNESVYRVMRIYEDVVKRFNAITVDSVVNGYVFKNINNISRDEYAAIYLEWKESKNSMV